VSIAGEVAIVGVGCTPFGEHFDKPWEDLAVSASLDALADAGLDLDRVDAAWVGTTFPGNSFGGGESGTSLADPLRLGPRPVTRIENQCASGMDAMRHAAFAVASGRHEVALAVGAEKLRDVSPRGSLVAGFVRSYHPVRGKGITAPGMFALLGTRQMKELSFGREVLADVAVKNHRNGARNPKAHFRKEVTKDEVLAAPIVSSPLGLLDCCPTTDGAAAVVVTSREFAEKHVDRYAVIRSITLATWQWHDNPYLPSHDFMGFKASQDSARRAYAEAGITDPVGEIDVVETHDCFTATELINIGDLGLADRADIPKLLADGWFDVDGEMPVNTSGGLQACGHPIGATGCRMVYQVVNQVWRRAGDMQVDGARVGMAHNLGGPGALSLIAIIEGVGAA